MGILPEKRARDDGPPPLVAHYRDLIGNSRVGRCVAKHKNGAAAVAGLLAVLKVWKWALWDLFWVIRHPGSTVSWVGGHLLLSLGITVAVFLVVFGGARLGIDWFSADDEPTRPRPRNRHVDTHVPGGA